MDNSAQISFKPGDKVLVFPVLQTRVLLHFLSIIPLRERLFVKGLEVDFTGLTVYQKNLSFWLNRRREVFYNG